MKVKLSQFYLKNKLVKYIFTQSFAYRFISNAINLFSYFMEESFNFKKYVNNFRR